MNEYSKIDAVSHAFSESNNHSKEAI
ncbi:hypothetical protein PUN4_120104 [Paraburkholderia unamae]|nr:hypothetical protein PUN4_120104 [Paraburkholderia unamae]